ncbi:MAG: hypothetical protein ACKV2T_30720 [Kofleriaceae bacterium]
MHPSIPAVLAFVDDYEISEALSLIEEIAEDLAGDHEQTIATMREIAKETTAKFEERVAVRALWIALGVATGDVAKEVVRELVKALDGESDDEGFARLHGELAQRYAGDPETELHLRLEIARSLDSWNERPFIVHNLRAAEALSTSDVERLAMTTSLLAHVANVGRYAPDAAAREAVATYRRNAGLDLDATVARCAALANKLAGDAMARATVIRADIEISRADPVLAHRHASRAFELAIGETPSSDPDLRVEAVHAFAELLLDAELLERADEVASTLEQDLASRVGGLVLVKGPDDGGGPWAIDGMGTIALLEDIRRRRGVLSEPPIEAFVPPPDDPADESTAIFRQFATATLPEGLAEYFTRDPNPASAIPRVVAPEKVREWSHGTVREIADLESPKIFGPVRSYTCRCNRYVGAKYRGVVCHRCGTEMIDRRARALRCGHIVLPEPVIHPWHASTIAALLGRGVRATQSANASEILDELKPLDYDVDRLATDLEHRRSNDPRLPVILAVRDNNIRPTWLVLEVLPVWPPDAPQLRDREEVARAYMEVLDGVDLRTAVSRLFSTIAKQLAPSA